MEIQGWKAIKSNEILKNHFASRWQGYLLSIFALFFLSVVQAEVSFYLFLYLSGFIYMLKCFYRKIGIGFGSCWLLPYFQPARSFWYVPYLMQQIYPLGFGAFILFGLEAY